MYIMMRYTSRSPEWISESLGSAAFHQNGALRPAPSVSALVLAEQCAISGPPTAPGRVPASSKEVHYRRNSGATTGY